MFKTLLSLILLLGSAGAVSAQKAKQSGKTASKSQVKFLDDIEVEIAPSSVEQRSELSEFEKQYFAKNTPVTKTAANSNFRIENVSKVQIKYALILDTEIEHIENVNLYAGIDEWMGTRYRLGGSTKDGIDCSALVQILYVTQFGANLPRTARERRD